MKTKTVTYWVDLVDGWQDIGQGWKPSILSTPPAHRIGLLCRVEITMPELPEALIVSAKASKEVEG